MKFFVRSWFTLAFLSLFSFIFAATRSNSQAFIENKGQWNLQAKFLAQSAGLNLWITEDGVVMDFNKIVPATATTKKLVAGHVVRMSFVGANPNTAAGVQELSGQLNYFHGNDSSRWIPNVRRYAEARTEGLYKGISARYYFSKNAQRYDLLLAAGADATQIGMKYEGAQGLQVLPNGNLCIKTSLGNIEEQGLLAYQATSSGNQQVACKMVADGDTVHFSLGSYDKSKELVIDPLIFSTFLGGGEGAANNSQVPYGIASDSSGNAVVLGYTTCAAFPTTVGAYRTNFTGDDIYVSKISANGTSLIYSTFIGGTTNSSTPSALALDSSGNAYITGSTFSSDFPATAGAYQTKNLSIPGGFISKISSTGNALLYSTLIGGGGADYPTGIALDSSNNAVIVGYGEDGEWPVTNGVIQTTQSPNSNECLIAKLSATGSQLIFASYLSGQASSLGDAAIAVALDSSANLYITGNTWCTDFPVTAGSFQTTLTGSDTGFIVKLSSDCSKELFGTFLGGDNGAQPTAIALTASNEPVVVGTTESTDFPLTAGAFQTTQADYHASFVSILSADGKSLLGSTLLSGTVEDNAYAVAVDKSGNIVLAGQADSPDFPTTVGAFQTVAGAYGDGFVSKLSGDCKTLLYSTFFGGNGDDLIQAMAVDPSGNAMVTGWTSSTDLPVSANAYQTINYATADVDTAATSFIANLGIGSGASQSVTLSLAPSTVTGGVLSYGTVTLSPAAPTGGATVAITSGATNLGSLPFTAGASQETFSLTTNPVDATDVVPITVSYNGGSQTQNLTIVPPALTTLGLNQTSIAGGTGVTATITLNGNAGPSGVTVTLTSSNTAAATVPASAKVLAGTSTITAPVTTKAVTANTPVTITAKFGAVTKTATLTVLYGAPALSSVSVAPTSVAAGVSVIGTATLTSSAPTTGIVVSLKSSNTAVAIVSSASITVASSTSKTFTVTALPVTVNTSVTITATVGTVSKTAVLTVTPAVISSVQLNATSVLGGTKVGGAAYLTGHSGTSPIVITLKSSNTAAALPPTSITVAPNTPGQYLTLTTYPVSADTVVTITGTTGSVSKSASLTVTAPVVSSVQLTFPSVPGGTRDGGAVYLTGHIGSAAMAIDLESSNPAAATVPSFISVPANAPGQYLTVTTNPVTVQTTVTITTTTGSVSKSATVVVTPSVSSVSLNATSVTGGAKVGGAAYLSGKAGSIPVVISLKSSNPAVASVPATIIATTGEPGQYLTVTTFAVKVKTVVTITATTGGVSRTVTLSVQPS